jgi:NAD(P)H-hydrate epimerase
MARLVGMKTSEILAERLKLAREFAAQHAVTLVLKGFRTLTAEPGGRVWVNSTGNPGMATGGTGDVLTGLIAGLLAQHRERPASEVTAAAVYLHGLAGDLAAAKMGQVSMIAGDMIDVLPQAFRSLAQGGAPQVKEPWN